MTAKLYRLESAGANASFKVRRSAAICAGVHRAGGGVARTAARGAEGARGEGDAKKTRAIDQIASAVRPARTIRTRLRLAARERFDLLL